MSNPVRSRLALAVLGIGWLAASAGAATLDEIVVTATRMPTPIDEVLAPTAIISREQLAQNLSTDVAELLRLHAGIELGRTGGIGQPTSIFIRGANSTHTLVMIDGVRINPATLGTAALQNIPPDSIERIEIVKGPRSTLYGTDAIGGVINIITRKPVEAGFDADARIGYGSFDTRQFSGAIGATGEIGHIGANVARITSDGFPTRRTSTVDSGYDNLALSGNAGVNLGRFKMGARVYEAEGTADYLDFLGRPLAQDFIDRVLRADVSGPITERWSTQLIASRMDNLIAQLQSPDFLRTRRNTLDWQHDLEFSERHRLTAGAMYADEVARALSFGSPYASDIDIVNVYAQDRLTLAEHSLLLAVGYTDYSTFGGHTTWNAEYGYRVTDNVTAIAAVGTAFRAPNATDLYGFGGNPHLDPESSRNAELSLRYRLDAHTFTLTAFQNDIDDLIMYDNAAFRVRNIAKARIRGYELSYAYAGHDWRVHAEAIYQDPRDRITDRLLLRRAKRSVTAGYSQTFDRLTVGLDALYSGKRMDFGFPTDVELDDYVLVNIHGNYAITPQWSLLVQIDNVTNTSYELARGFNTAERSGSLALRFALR